MYILFCNEHIFVELFSVHDMSCTRTHSSKTNEIKKGLFFCIRKLVHALEMSKAYSTQLGCGTCTGNRIIHGNIKTVDVIEEDLSQLFDKDIADDIEAYFSARNSNTRENDDTSHVYGQLK